MRIDLARLLLWDAAKWRACDSPVFNFINSLSPIPPPKPSDSAHNVQLFKSSDLAPVSSIFASPHVNPAKESKLLIRDDSVHLSRESHSPNSVRTRIGATSSIRMIRCKNIVSENCSITCYLNESNSNKSSQSIQLCSDSAESDKDQNTDGKKDPTREQDHTDLEFVLLDQSGPEKMDSLHSGNNACENQLSEQHKDELGSFDGGYMIAHQSNSDMLRLTPPFESETHLVNETLGADNVYCESLLTDGSSGSYIQNSAPDPHLYWAGTVEGSATDYTPQMIPGACQSQLLPNDQIGNKLNEPSDYMPLDQNVSSQNLRGMRRRCLFNEKAGAANKGVKNTSVRHSSNLTTPRRRTSSSDNNLKTLRTPPCALPGIGLHLNALAAVPKDKTALRNDTEFSLNQASNAPSAVGSSPPTADPHTVNDDSSQTAVVAYVDECSQGSPKKKRHKFDNGDSTSCKRCSCKKSKCLKLYCECFHAGVFCSEPCSCQGCLNKPSNMETVLSTREQIESRNPLAFAPKVIRTEPGQEIADDSNKTPASARHKRGCNCKKSSCLKKYCECYQGGVGCSVTCRCEGCKNAFGRREGVSILSMEEAKRGSEDKNGGVKEETIDNDKQLVIYQDTTNLTPPESVLTTPLVVDCRPLVPLPPLSSKKPRSSTKLGGYSSRLEGPLKSDILLSPFESYAEMMLGDGTSNTLKGESSPQTSVKVVSPNKKRVSPPRIGTGLSPICKSGRKLILKSIPSFPSLGGDLTNVDPNASSLAP
uniref:CRC domain-containing protein n=1 Tax=Oryza brachyantha TaxID=4533 RepID=J3NET6_ORYBR